MKCNKSQLSSYLFSPQAPVLVIYVLNFLIQCKNLWKNVQIQFYWTSPKKMYRSHILPCRSYGKILQVCVILLSDLIIVPCIRHIFMATSSQLKHEIMKLYWSFALTFPLSSLITSPMVLCFGSLIFRTDTCINTFRIMEG